MKTTTPTVGTTQAEADVLAATAAAIAAGQDPFGDDGEDDEPEATTTAAAGAEEEGTKAAAAEEATTAAGEGDEVAGDDDDGAELTPEQLAAIAGEEEEPEQAPAPRYKTADPAELKAQRDEQIALKAKALKDLMDGVIEPEEYSRIESDVADKLEELAVQRTLHAANVQTEQQDQEAELDKIIAAAKKAGEIDYKADPKAAKQFDTAMAILAQDGEKRTYAELVAEAHEAVLAVRRIKPKEPAAAPTPAQPRENGKGPMTLRNIPAAETPNSGGGWKEQLAALSGQAYEEAFAKLSPGQRAELLND